MLVLIAEANVLVRTVSKPLRLSGSTVESKKLGAVLDNELSIDVP